MEYLENTENKQSTSISTSAKILIGATGGIAVGLSIISASFVAPAFRRICLPFVPATNVQITNVLSFLPKNPQGRLLDIGSGDGRIVVAAAKHGFKADGVELNPWLVLFSRFFALREGVNNKTRFFRSDLWKFNITQYNYIVIFGVEQMMKDLEVKLIKEASADAKVIACRFPLPNLLPHRTIEDGVNSVWLYKLNKMQN